MRKTKKLLALLTACTLVAATSLVNMSVVKAETTTATTAVANESPKERPLTASEKYAEAMQPGWNLGNSYEAVNWSFWDVPDAIDNNPGTLTDETCWGGPVVTKALIDKIAAEGFKSIRMPFTAESRLGAAPDYTINPTYLKRYAQTVQWAIDAGLYVMVNIHHDSYQWGNFYEADDDNGASEAKFKVVWTQLANYLKDFDDKVCFESLNEPDMKNHNGPVSSDVCIKRLADLNANFIKIVRGTGGKNATRMLVLPSHNTNYAAPNCTSVYNTIQEANDPNIMATIHYYGHWCFSENINGWSTFDDNVVKDIRNAFDNVYDIFISKGIGVVVGEYGLLGQGFNNQNKGEILKYMDYVNYYARVNHVTLQMWDGGLFMDEKNLTWKDENLDVLNTMKASWTGRNSFPKADSYFIKDKNSDIVIPLILNGNTLTSINSGSYKLVEGQDYTYANSTVTLKGSYISKIALNPEGEFYGTRSILTFKFSAGVDSKTEIILSKAPVLGKTPILTIPIQYNGSRISEMETVDADGKSASPMGWTSYIDEGSYKINYDANTLTLTEYFFKELKVNQFTLKIHLQNGEEMDILINRDGDHITYSAK